MGEVYAIQNVPAFSVLVNPSNYQFNPHAVPIFIATALIAFLGWRVRVSQKTTTTLRFGALCLSFIVWLGFTGIGYLVHSDGQIAAFWFRLDWVGVSFISMNYYAFSTALLDRQNGVLIRVGYALAIFFAITTLIWNPQMRAVEHYGWGFFPLHGHTWSLFFFAYFFGFIQLTFLTYWRAIRENSDPGRLNQFRCMFGAFTITILGAVDFLPTFGFNIYPWGYITIVCFVAISAYGIVSFQLMDIRVVIQKTVFYSAVTVVLTTTYLLLAGQLTRLLEGWTGQASFWSSALAAAGLAFLVNPVQNWIRSFLDERFFGNWLQDMSRGVAHEVKRPLNRITLPAGMALMMLEEVSKGKKSFDSVFPALKKQLQAIVDQTLDAGRTIDALQRVADHRGMDQSVNLENVVQACITRLSTLIERSHIPITLEMSGLSPVAGDAEQLEIALGNLMKNALEACSGAPEKNPPDPCTLSVYGREENGTVCVSIKDTGPGMHPDVKAKLFEPYKSTKGSAGMGIGLYLTHKIILNHGGSIKVVSELGKGTEFILTLPKIAAG